MSNYLDKFQTAIRESGRRRGWSPAMFLEAWGSFVGECEDGYTLGIYEYDNDLGVRDVIERALTSPMLASDPELPVFAEAVAAVDARLAIVINSGPQIRSGDFAWWRRRLPAEAGEELVSDARRLFDVDVGIRE